MGTLRRMLIHIGEEPWAASVRQAGDQLVVCPKKGGALANGRNRSTTGVTSRWLFSKKVSGTGRASRHPIGQNRPLQAALIGGSGMGAGAPAAEPSGSGARPGLLPARAARAARAAEGRAPRGLSGAVPAGRWPLPGSAGSPGAAAPGRRLSALLVLLGGAAHPAPRPVSCQGAAGCAGHKERAGGRCGTTAPPSRARPPTGPDPTAPRPRTRPGAHRPRPRGREKFAARPRGPDQRGLRGASSAGARYRSIDCLQGSLHKDPGTTTFCQTLFPVREGKDREFKEREKEEEAVKESGKSQKKVSKKTQCRRSPGRRAILREQEAKGGSCFQAQFKCEKSSFCGEN
ncbi:collagen alpha-4(IV) chain-like [Delphinapterus leucas]|uniref:Collagen alpha-4(IV) chain-like n=1 Tax=Delphinapterus leucas TaxID=9749 RepID=A0A7F8K4W4_DELLE|nr:collagen alpha-4(IV) chain-like [Delphinapterus leucas]